MGFQLVKGSYVPVPPDVDGSIYSDVLGLDFHIRERRLAVYDPIREQWLQTPAEQHAARAENAETRAAQETIARQKAEEELERLQEQLMTEN